MSNSKLYQPPPPPPRPKEPAKDPLLVLSRAPEIRGAERSEPRAGELEGRRPSNTNIAPVEELTDLTDDEVLEEWAKGGTRIMPKPQSQAAPTMLAGPAPMPSFYPVAMNAAPVAPPKKSSAAIWVAVLGVIVLALGAAAAIAGVYVYRAHDVATETVTATTAPAVTVTDPPAVTVTPTVTATATAAPTVTAASTSTRHVATSTTSTSAGTGTIRTFAIGNGKPVYVDGKQVGVGGAKLTTACGRHLVAVGTGHAKSVEIPCNGTTITVGTPDGE